MCLFPKVLVDFVNATLAWKNQQCTAFLRHRNSQFLLLATNASTDEKYPATVELNL